MCVSVLWNSIEVELVNDFTFRRCMFLGGND